MEFKQEIDKLLFINENIGNYEKYKIINNCYLIDNGRLCYNFNLGDTRYPYVNSGKTLWCHANGNISLTESSLYTIQDVLDGEANRVSFNLGIQHEKDEEYDFYSLFTLDANLYPRDAVRFTYFKDSYVVYVLIVNDVIYAMRATLGVDKKAYFEVYVKNNGHKEAKLYSSMFMNINLIHGNYNSIETKWFRKVEYKKDEFVVSTVEDGEKNHIYNFAKLKRCVSDRYICEFSNTTSRRVFANSKTNQINQSECLLKGRFFEDKYTTTFSDIGICGDFVRFFLQPKQEIILGYSLTNYDNEKTCNDDIEPFNINIVDMAFLEKDLNCLNYWDNEDNLTFNFGESNKIDSTKFNLFIKELIKQVDYCALTKNSSQDMLGVRDIFQAIEAGLIWNKKDARRKILEGLNFLGLNGRSPRQYSMPMKGEKIARIDDREFIDQDLWIIDAIYQYLGYTDDYEFLDEICGYTQMNNEHQAIILEVKDDVLSHMIKIVDYLTSHIDEKTHCLCTLYGDWNDAINGLGRSDDPSKFGNGVSIMATLQLYSCLHKVINILNHVNKYPEYVIKCQEAIKTLTQGINDNAFVSDRLGNSKILHGWGDDKSFLVGSFKDIDGHARDTLTSNAFYILSDFYKENPKYINDVLKAYERLDSRYGYKTFEPFFDKDASKVGRIVNLPKGTAENAATYIHATVFALDSLFKIDKDEKAWEQIFKVIPITHDYVSTTPFTMPNSYLFNRDLDCDGESMNDWFTGSSSTLLKSLVKNAFGLHVEMNHISIYCANYMPFENAQMHVKVVDTNVNIKYIKTTNKDKKITINNNEIKDYQIVDGKRVVRIEKSDLKDMLNITIEI